MSSRKELKETYAERNPIGMPIGMDIVCVMGAADAVNPRGITAGVGCIITGAGWTPGMEAYSAADKVAMGSVVGSPVKGTTGSGAGA